MGKLLNIEKENIGDYITTVKEFIENTYSETAKKESTEYNKIIKPELILASRKTENPIRVINTNNDFIYYINIKNIKAESDEIKKYNETQTSSIIDKYNIISVNSESSVMHITTTIFNDNDILQMENITSYFIHGKYDTIFPQLLSGIFMTNKENQCYNNNGFINNDIHFKLYSDGKSRCVVMSLDEMKNRNVEATDILYMSPYTVIDQKLSTTREIEYDSILRRIYFVSGAEEKYF